MGWLTKTGQHEGNLLPCFADGQRGNGVLAGDFPADHVAVDGMPAVEAGDELGARRASRTWPAWRTRPAADVVGWQVVCTCQREDRPPVTWTGPVIARAAKAADERLELDVDFLTGDTATQLAHLGQLRLHSPDEKVAVVTDRGEVESIASAIWLWLHAGPTDQLEPVRQAARDVRTAERRLADAAGAARRAGIPAGEIDDVIAEGLGRRPSPNSSAE